jgi:hypothetical protein
MTEEWTECFAWLPVRSTWSNKLIWFKKYHLYKYQYIKLGKPACYKLMYTQKEFLMMLLRNEKEIY